MDKKWEVISSFDSAVAINSDRVAFWAKFWSVSVRLAAKRLARHEETLIAREAV